MRLILMVLGLAALAGCGVEMDAKNAAKKLLNDPGSAEFSDLRKGSEPDNVCGYLNAKNRMGGYVGKTPFFYEGATQMVAIVAPAEDGDFRSIWLGIRLNDFANDLEKTRQKCEVVAKWPAVCGSSYPGPKHDLCDVILDGGASGIYTALRDKYDR